jgi:hypothetical protein
MLGRDRLLKFMESKQLRSYRSGGAYILLRSDVEALVLSGNASVKGLNAVVDLVAKMRKTEEQPVKGPAKVSVQVKLPPQDLLFWALPTGKDKRWVVPENDKALEWATRMVREKAIMATGLDSSSSLFRGEDRFLLGILWDKMTSSLRKIGIIALAGIAWLGFGYVIDRRIPEGIGFIFTVLGLAAIVYAGVRHGYAAYRWWNLHESIEDNRSMAGREWCRSALIGEIEKAIKFRESLKTTEQRGGHPDQELLDAKDYEKLSAEKGIPVEDIVRLSKSLQREFGQRTAQEISEDFNLTIHAAGVYKDLADAGLTLETNAVVKTITE